MKIKQFKRISIIVLVLIVLNLIAAQFIGIHNGLFSNASGDCIAVVFDKSAVIGADKIVYVAGNREITITDPDTVKNIAKRFVVANRAGLCNSLDNKYMYIYNGDKLVRSMRWRCCEEIVDIYEEDGLHWLLPPECSVGQVELSKDFLDYLDTLLPS